MASGQRITLLLLKEDLEGEDVWISERIAERVDLANEPLAGTLAIGFNSPRPPTWSKYLSDHIDSEHLARLRNSSTSAAILFEAEDRKFIASFGYGRSMVNPEVCEPDFGLKVVVNSIERDRLKSVDARGFEEITRHSKTDVSRESSLSAFELDIERDVVRSMTGSPADEGLAKRLSGADALGFTTKRPLPELPSLCGELLEAYRADRYKQSGFGFIDHLRRVTDKGLKAELDDMLVEALKQGGDALEDVHLAIPEAIDWLSVSGVRFDKEPEGDELAADPSIRAYLELIAGKKLNLARLRREQVLAISAENSQPLGNWSVYRCIVYQVEREDRLYVLSAGEWFWVAQNYAEEVSTYVAELPRLDLDLPSCPAGSRERDYNELAASETGSLCMDGVFVTRASPDWVEVCDLLTPEKQLIHVKKRGASSTLSHLFSQGLNSAGWLRDDADFRAEAREKAEALNASIAASLPLDDFEPSDYEVSFVVITRSKRDTPLTLPFFSLVSLRNAARTLRRQGFRVSAAEVQETAALPTDEGGRE